jgi:opacity protein-like surface antigen
MKPLCRNLLFPLLAASVCGAALAQPTESAWYGEIGLSQLNLKVTDGLSAKARPSLLTGTIGYQWLPHLAVEGFVAGGIDRDEVKLNGVNTGIDAKVPSAFGIFLKPGIALGDRVELFGRVGYARTKVRLSAGGVNVDDSNDDLAYGLGLNVNLSRQSYLQANWMNYYDKHQVKLDGLGLVYGRRF